MVEKQQIDIKQISIRQVGAVKTILAKSGFTFENVKEDSTKDGYTTYGTFKTPSAIIVVRLSNHICSMKNWTERYKPKLIAKPKLLRRMGKNIQDPYKERCFFSIVFKAFDYSVNDSGSWKAICNEYVFNPIEVEEGGTIGKIANDAKGLNRGKPSTINGIQPQIREVNNENENLPKATDKIPQNISVDKNGNWVSTNGWGADYVSENKQYNTNRNMKQTIKLRESELKRIIAESVKRAINEVWDIDDNGVIDYDEFGRAKNRSYADVRGLSRGLASDTKELLRNTPHRDFRAETNYQYRLDEPNGREFSDDSGEWLRPSDWFARGADGWNDDEFNDYDKQIGNNHGTNISASDKRWKKAADSRPLHRKGSLNRAMDETINRIVSESIRNLR